MTRRTSKRRSSARRSSRRLRRNGSRTNTDTNPVFLPCTFCGTTRKNTPRVWRAVYGASNTVTREVCCLDPFACQRRTNLRNT